MIFRQKKFKKKEKIYQALKIIIFWVDFVPQSQHPSHIIPNAKCHPERCASSYALASKNDSGSHHSSTKPLIPGFPIRSSSSSSQAPPAVDCSAGPPITPHSTKTFTRIKTQRKTASNIKTESKSFCPKQKTNFLLAL